jgi:uncharacterized protein (TIGR02001 family)
VLVKYAPLLEVKNSNGLLAIIYKETIMKKKGILLIAVLLLSVAGLAQGQQGDLATTGELAATVDLTYVSSYIWRGFDLYSDDHSAIQPSLDIDLYGSGFGINIWWSRANTGTFEDAEEFDYTLRYSNSVFEGQSYAADYTVGWVYYNYPDNSRTDRDAQEAFGVISLPDLCPMGIVPSFTAIRMWQSNGGTRSTFHKQGGWAYMVALDYDLTITGFMPNIPEQVIGLRGELWYNDGVGASHVDSGLSHAVFSVSSPLDLTNNLTFTPGVYHQLSMEDDVNTEDETWMSLSLAYKF